MARVLRDARDITMRAMRGLGLRPIAYRGARAEGGEDLEDFVDPDGHGTISDFQLA